MCDMERAPVLSAMIARDLHRRRDAEGLTQARAAARMGASQQMLARLEGGRGRDLTLGLLERWAAALGLRASVTFRPARAALAPRVPRSLYRYFWDTDPRTIDPPTHARYVVERLLEYGNLSALGWLRTAYPKPILRRTARTSRRLSPRARNFVRYL